MQKPLLPFPYHQDNEIFSKRVVIKYYNIIVSSRQHKVGHCEELFYTQVPNQHWQLNMINISLSFVTVNKPNWCRSKHLFHVWNRAWLSKKHSDEWPWGGNSAVINRQSVMQSAYSALTGASSLPPAADLRREKLTVPSNE